MSRSRAARLAVGRHDAEWTQRALATLLLLSALTFGLMTLSGCNTLAGAGQDVSAAGQAVTNSAEQTKQAM